ncbi:MAG TPA: phosphatase PAP2 family protein [Acetobacteraceae bacterium]|nr:phosphatase PAP2 family protein [Acetobacteraceae bacterium]
MRHSLNRYQLAWIVLAGLVSIPLCITSLDRPIAYWVNDHAYGALIFLAMAGIAQPVLQIASLGVIGAAIAAGCGWRPGPRGRVLLAAAVAAILAIAFKDQLKFCFGRTWPESWLGNNPSFIRDDVFGFHPFHGGRGYQSFPSGHTTAITAPMMVLWVCWPRGRILYAAAILAVMIGLLGDNFHFLSDIIGGFLVGLLSAAAVLTLARAVETPLNRGRPGSPGG